MGRGDIKTKKGKRRAGSYGVSRPRKTEAAVVTPKKKAVPKKASVTPKEAVAEKKAPVKKAKAAPKK